LKQLEIISTDAGSTTLSERPTSVSVDEGRQID
jgi:hypothetical protein